MGEFGGFWRAIRVVARVLFPHLLGWTIDVQGREHLPEGGAVLAFNHHGDVDAVFVAWGPVIEERRQVVAAHRARFRARRSRDEGGGVAS